MTMLDIYVCENFAPDYIHALKAGGFEDVLIRPFPCWCSWRGDPAQFFAREGGEHPQESVNELLICGRQCPALTGNSLPAGMRTYTFNYCQEYSLSDSMISFIIEKGGYLVAPGWLEKWEERLCESGFDRELARRFYQECARELILIDTGSSSDAKDKMASLSAFLDIPYRIISTGIEGSLVLLRSIVYPWRLQCRSDDYEAIIGELRKERAEYSAVLKIIERLTISAGKREIIGKLMEVCTVLFGAGSMRFHDRLEHAGDESPEINKLFESPGQSSLMTPGGDTLYIKIQYEEEIFGVLVISGFIFPQYIERYISLALNVSRIAALALSNATKMEALERSRDTMAYLSYHDALTGLHNRARFNQALEQLAECPCLAVFMCDVDGLKEVNDLLGHIEGDRLIRMAAEALRQSFRETDILARIGGDEFAALVPDCNDETATAILKRIEDAVEAQNRNGISSFALGMSVGYALKKGLEADLESAVKEADMRMYENKQKRKKQAAYGSGLESR